MAFSMVMVTGMPPFFPRTTMEVRSLSISRSFSCTTLAKPVDAASTQTSLIGSL